MKHLLSKLKIIEEQPCLEVPFRYRTMTKKDLLLSFPINDEEVFFLIMTLYKGPRNLWQHYVDRRLQGLEIVDSWNEIVKMAKKEGMKSFAKELINKIGLRYAS